ncbi:hypothetical protein M8542_25375 [Amycolatopsis sp. OK19-0408]|uniref:Uncharacterized protein n=1 Tax=Amycolatopsis iheyensis TaxID=2945988 RepID=A0A9X2NCJ1_9PSEU|nr:hypothetical protein [Amycolatopsis iheyensis]MCR6486164.1 hypothetical protein [Amycolatopsis iheyensis]
MTWIILGIFVAVLLGIAVVVDLRDRGRKGKRIAGGLRAARQTDIVQDPQVGDQGNYLGL